MDGPFETIIKRSDVVGNTKDELIRSAKNLDIFCKKESILNEEEIKDRNHDYVSLKKKLWKKLHFHTFEKK